MVSPAASVPWFPRVATGVAPVAGDCLYQLRSSTVLTCVWWCLSMASSWGTTNQSCWRWFYANESQIYRNLMKRLQLRHMVRPLNVRQLDSEATNSSDAIDTCIWYIPLLTTIIFHWWELLNIDGYRVVQWFGNSIIAIATYQWHQCYPWKCHEWYLLAGHDYG